MNDTTLGVAIITKNAARRLDDCLRAVSFADEIVIVDSGSTDDTLDIARAHGARVIETPDWPGFGPQKNRALDALATTWVLSIDSDEIVSPELAASIRAAIQRADRFMYSVDRLSSFCGQWIHHGGWYPDWIPRLFLRGDAWFSDDLVHERLVFDMPVKRLGGKLMHYSYEDYESVLRKLDDYSSAGARQRHATGQRGGFGKAVARGAWAFIRTYVLRHGFLDGKAGYQIAAFNAQTVYYRFLKLAYLNETRINDTKR